MSTPNEVTGVWVVRPPQMNGGIQWPVQFHRDERMAARMVVEHHTVGVQSAMTREEFLTLHDKLIVEAAEAWERGYEDMAISDAAFDLLTLRLVTAVRMKREGTP